MTTNTDIVLESTTGPFREFREIQTFDGKTVIVPNCPYRADDPAASDETIERRKAAGLREDARARRILARLLA